MNYIVFDLEWNQSSFGKKFSNKKLPFEIIEIGAVKLNSDLQEIGRFNELVRPKVYKNLRRLYQILRGRLFILYMGKSRFNRIAKKY